MKLLSVFFAVAVLISTTSAQYTTRNFVFDGKSREYLLYVPSVYDGSTAVPFVMALHGLGDNMNNFKNINFKAIADTANFIFAVPQALVDSLLSGSTAWNSGAGMFGVSLNADVDDVGFLNALIDTVAAEFNIDQTRIYATGFSMGGFMSNRLACELNNRIAAIASVSGTIGGTLNCQPERAIPVAHFHGTTDPTVAYSGNNFGNDAEELIAFWSQHNNCDTLSPVIDSLPNTANDGKTVIHYSYLNGDFNTEVEFFKVIGGQHEWLIAANDISYTAEIWKFFSRFKWEEQTGIANSKRNELSMNVFPNPASGTVNVQFNEKVKGNTTIKMIDVTGNMVYSETLRADNSAVYTIPLSAIGNGIYILQMENNEKKSYNRIVVAQ